MIRISYDRKTKMSIALTGPLGQRKTYAYTCLAKEPELRKVIDDNANPLWEFYSVAEVARRMCSYLGFKDVYGSRKRDMNLDLIKHDDDSYGAIWHRYDGRTQRVEKLGIPLNLFASLHKAIERELNINSKKG